MLTTKRNPASPKINQPTHQPTNPEEQTTIRTVQSHQRSSQRHFDRARINLAFGKITPTSIAIRRSASHAVTAAAMHWHFRAHTKRRLTNALRCIVHDVGLPPGHLVTFVEVYSCTPDVLEAADRRDALRILTRLHRRVRRLADDLNHAIAEHPNPPTLDQVVARIQASPPPPPEPTITTLGELYEIFDEPLDSQYHDHPLDCPDCNRLRRDPTVRRSIIFGVSRPPCIADQWPRRFTRVSDPHPS